MLDKIGMTVLKSCSIVIISAVTILTVGLVGKAMKGIKEI